MESSTYFLSYESTTDVPETYSQYNNITVLVIRPTRSWPGYFKVAIDIRNYGWPAILIIGTFSNMMSAITFSRPAMRNSTTATLFRALAVCELVYILLTLVPSVLDIWFGVEMIEQTNISCRIWFYIIYTMKDLASWMLVLVALERLALIVHPHTAKIFITTTKVTCAVVVVFIILASLNCPLLFIVRSAYKASADAYMCVIEGQTARFKSFSLSVWPWMDFLLYCALPLIIMTLSNVTIIILLVHKERQRISALFKTPECSTSQAPGRKVKTLSMTAILLTVCFTYLALSLPLCVHYLLKKPKGFETDALLFYAQTCQYINHSCNFFLYCLSSPSFRSQVRVMFSGTSDFNAGTSYIAS